MSGSSYVTKSVNTLIGIVVSIGLFFTYSYFNSQSTKVDKLIDKVDTNQKEIIEKVSKVKEEVILQGAKIDNLEKLAKSRK